MKKQRNENVYDPNVFLRQSAGGVFSASAIAQPAGTVYPDRNPTGSTPENRRHAL